MIPYFLAAILLVGIPFLLYCLWGFSRDLNPHRSSVVVRPGSRVARSRALPISSFRTKPQVVDFQAQSRSAS
jgi:hypothetical protein